MGLGSKKICRDFAASTLENASVARQERVHIFVHLESSVDLHKGWLGILEGIVHYSCEEPDWRD